MAPAPGDEDGPAEEEQDLVDEMDEFTDDEDPPSSDAGSAPEKKEDVETESPPLERPPRVAWKAAVSGYAGYFERQRGAHCGMHALNNAVGRDWQTVEDMQHACDDYLMASHHEGLLEIRAEHAKPSGWYSIEVMCHAMNTTSMRVLGRVEFVISLEPLHANPNAISTSIGAVVNIGNRHWVALRKIGDQVWLLDSQEPLPLRLTDVEYKTFISRRRHAFPIRRAEEMAMFRTGALHRKLSNTSAAQSAPSSEDPMSGTASASLSSDGSGVVLPFVARREGGVIMASAVAQDE